MPLFDQDGLERDSGNAAGAGEAGSGAVTAAVKEYCLSYNQEFFCMLDEGDHRGAFGDRHTLVGRWWLTGPVDVATLQAALDDVVSRHEILRTSIARTAVPRYQLVHPPTSVRLKVQQLVESPGESRQLHCERLMADCQAEPFNVADLPLLRAVLGRFDEREAVLILTMHHIACDAWSMQVLIAELAACYARRRGFQVDRPPIHQYREYCRA
ncbi:MAG: condensation domain-containing protein, partial [Jatrophihabitantaceae bacterium]